MCSRDWNSAMHSGLNLCTQERLGIAPPPPRPQPQPPADPADQVADEEQTR